MATPACQEVVGGGAVVFPAIPSATQIAQDAHAANGVDVSAFTTHVDDGTPSCSRSTTALHELKTPLDRSWKQSFVAKPMQPSHSQPLLATLTRSSATNHN
jgi:hypothetical protein